MNTILQDVKIICKAPHVTDYDDELIILTNQALQKLAKIGGCSLGLAIDNETMWEDVLIHPDIKPFAVSYVGGIVLIMFDPPASSAAVTAYNEMIKENEWSIQEIVEGRLQ